MRPGDPLFTACPPCAGDLCHPERRQLIRAVTARATTARATTARSRLLRRSLTHPDLPPLQLPVTDSVRVHRRVPPSAALPHPSTLGTVGIRSLLGLAVAAAAGLGLVATNPGEEEFERFAADQITRAAELELCHEGGLPMLARLIVHDCPRLIAAQHDLLGRLALAATRRRNFGLLSLYRTDLGGQQLLPDWSIPRYSAITLAAAGRFFILRSNQATAEPTVR